MGLILVCFYKFDEVLLGDFKNVGMEILEVYGYQCVWVQWVLFVIFFVYNVIGCVLNFVVFYYIGQVFGFVYFIYFMVDMAGIRECFIQLVINYVVVVWCVVVFQEVCYCFEVVDVVVIICIDDCEGFVNFFVSDQYSVGCILGFFLFREFVDVFYGGIDGLKGIFDFYFIVEFVVEFFVESFFNIFMDDKDDFVKVGVDGIVNGVFNDYFFVGAKAVELFEAIVVVVYIGCKDK